MSQSLESVPAAGRAQEIPYGYPSMGLGHCITPDVPVIPTGCSLRTYDVNLDATGEVAQRGGIVHLAENGACGRQITNCEEVIGFPSWTAGFVTEDTTVDADGTKHWREFKYGGPGTTAKRLTVPGALANSLSSFLILPGPVNLGADSDDYICFWFYVDDKSAIDWAAGGPRITLETVANVDVFTLSAPRATLTDRVADGKPWNFVMLKKSDAVASTANADWANIVRIGIKWNCIAGQAGKFITFDNIWLGPAHLYGLFNYRRSVAKGGGNWIVAAGHDSLCVLIPEEQRWRFLRGERGVAQAGGVNTITLAATASATDNYYKNQLITIEAGSGAAQTQRIISYVGATKLATVDAAWGVAVDATSSYVIGALSTRLPVSFVALNDWLYVMNGIDRMLLLTDNLRAYDAGIDPPTTIPTVVSTAGAGSVVSGSHILAVRFYSEITGRESDPVFSATAFVGVNNSTLHYTNLPVSLDPKVTHLRLYRLAPGQPGYKRVSTSITGEVVNGVTMYDDAAASTALGDIMDRSPSGGDDLNGIPPRARRGVVLNGYFVADDADQPGRLHVARVGAGEQWPLDSTIALDEGDGDDITGLAANWGLVIAFKSNAFHPMRLAGGGLQPFVVQDRRSRFGAVSHGGIHVSTDVIRFRHHTGYFQMGQDMKARPIANGWRRASRLPLAEPSLQDFDKGRAHLMTSAYLSSRRQVYFCEVKQGSVYPNVQAVLHEDLAQEVVPSIYGGWAFHRAPVSIIADAQLAGVIEDYIVGGGAAGLIYRLDMDYVNDRSPAGETAIDMHYVTPPLDQREKAYGLGPSILKHYRWLDMIMRPGGLWPLDVEGFYDWRSSEASAILSDTIVSATSTTIVFSAAASTRDNFYANKYIVVRDGAGIDQQRRIMRYVGGATKTAHVDAAWTVTPAGGDNVDVRNRLSHQGSLAPTAQTGGGIGVGFIIGTSIISPSGGEFQRMRLPRGRHRSIILSFRNNRIHEAPGITQFSLWVIAVRASGRIA